MLKPSVPLSLTLVQHKLGADRPEKFMAIPVDPNNRLVDLGPAREIEVSWVLSQRIAIAKYNVGLDGF